MVEGLTCFRVGIRQILEKRRVIAPLFIYNCYSVLDTESKWGGDTGFPFSRE
jgi:hypothetical protein